jgi:hypothetical protein
VGRAPAAFVTWSVTRREGSASAPKSEKQILQQIVYE